MKKKIFSEGEIINKKENKVIAGYKKSLNGLEAFFIMILFFS